jgi:hypothetical protein
MEMPPKTYVQVLMAEKQPWGDSRGVKVSVRSTTLNFRRVHDGYRG